MADDSARAELDDLDPITLEVYWNRLITIMDEVDLAVVRTAFSTIIAEARDFAVMLMDAEAMGLAQSVLSLAHFTAMIPRCARNLLEAFPPETLEDGDVLFTNDPWLASGHLPDYNVVKPVFHKGKLIAYIGFAGHVADVGGTITYFGATDVYEEGLRIPPVKIYRAGKPNDDVLNLIAANTRVPEMVLGDLRGMMAAAYVGERQLGEFLEDTGLEDIQSISRAIKVRSERVMREAIAKIEPGAYKHAVTIDGFPEPATIAATVTVKGETLKVDFDGTSAETRGGGVNGTFSATIGDAFNALKSALVPEIPNNEALFEPIEVTAPEGCILNCTFPAPVKGRSVTSLHTHEAIYGALAQVIPNQVQAGTGIGLLVVVNGRHPDGKAFNAYLLAGGGVGALNEKDGLNVSNFPVNCSVTPTEVFENHVPLLLMRKEFRPDSGGDGFRRGGLGQRIVFRTQGETPATITMRPNNRQFPPPGFEGGQPGALCEVYLNGERYEPTVVTLKQGDEMVCDLPGGGGFGPPEERSPELRARDLELGYTTR